MLGSCFPEEKEDSTRMNHPPLLLLITWASVRRKGTGFPVIDPRVGAQIETGKGVLACGAHLTRVSSGGAWGGGCRRISFPLYV